MVANQKDQSREDQDQKDRANSQETQGNSDDNSSNRGFAHMDDNKQREITSKDGKGAHELERAHEFSSQEVRKIGRKRRML